MKEHYTEADLLEMYYLQPGEPAPVMTHLASCTECVARYQRLQRKLREAAACPEKPATFWAFQRGSIMRRIDAQRRAAATTGPRTWRIAAAAMLAFFLGGAVVYETVPKKAPLVTPPAASATKEGATDAGEVAVDPWQSDELNDFHAVVQWESWVADGRTTGGGSSL